MDVERFTRDPEVLRCLEDLRRDCKDKEFSDVVDGEGRQYVDLVMEGGGVLGVALVGYTYVLEQMKIRFLRIGGTSAGSINALLMAALDVPERPKSEKVAGLLANLDMYTFVDAEPDVRDVIEGFLRKTGRLRMALELWQARDELGEAMSDLGLSPGDAFRSYLSGVLRENGVRSARDLGRRMRTFPNSLRKRREPDPVFSEDGFRLALVAADVSTETKVVFPEMAALYWADTDGVDPAFFVRASMSIPFFFHPLRLTDIPQDEAAKERWRRLANYDEEPPEECLFVDGGIMSNFPIDLFHNLEKTPAAPTFGVKIGAEGRKRKRIENLGQLAFAIFDAARHTLDYDFIARNRDYARLVKQIDTGDHNWLNFDMPESDKVDLFVRGARAATEFLRGFDWEAYKQTRSQIARQFDAATV